MSGLSTIFLFVRLYFAALQSSLSHLFIPALYQNFRPSRETQSRAVVYDRDHYSPFPDCSRHVILCQFSFSFRNRHFCCRTGAAVSYIGRYWHILFLFPAFTCIGSGLTYTFTSTTSDGNVIGYQVRLIFIKDYDMVTTLQLHILASMGTGCLLHNSDTQCNTASLSDTLPEVLCENSLISRPVKYRCTDMQMCSFNVDDKSR